MIAVAAQIAGGGHHLVTAAHQRTVLVPIELAVLVLHAAVDDAVAGGGAAVDIDLHICGGGQITVRIHAVRHLQRIAGGTDSQGIRGIQPGVQHAFLAPAFAGHGAAHDLIGAVVGEEVAAFIAQPHHSETVIHRADIRHHVHAFGVGNTFDNKRAVHIAGHADGHFGRHGVQIVGRLNGAGGVLPHHAGRAVDLPQGEAAVQRAVVIQHGGLRPAAAIVAGVVQAQGVHAAAAAVIACPHRHHGAVGQAQKLGCGVLIGVALERAGAVHRDRPERAHHPAAAAIGQERRTGSQVAEVGLAVAAGVIGRLVEIILQ